MGSLTDFPGDDLIDLGVVDQFISPFLALLPWPGSFFFSVAQSLGFLEGGVVCSVFLDG